MVPGAVFQMETSPWPQKIWPCFTTLAFCASSPPRLSRDSARCSQPLHILLALPAGAAGQNEWAREHREESCGAGGLAHVRLELVLKRNPWLCRERGFRG